MEPLDEITALIPHRPPFLWVDRIVSYAGDTIITEKTIPAELDVFSGHYPGNPIMPGVLLCEAIFQSGALLMGKLHEGSAAKSRTIPVLTRIHGAKFKKNVLPGDMVRIKVHLVETVSSVCFFKGNMTVRAKTAVQVEFACAMIDPGF